MYAASPRKSSSAPLPRRAFLKTTLAAGAASLLAPKHLLGAAAASRQKVRLACVGIGNRGREVVLAMQATGLAKIVALCDTEMEAPHTQAVLKRFTDAPRFRDFRRMFDRMAGDIDAVCVCTPDFSHFPVTMLAMSLGKHVYVEKPMAHSFRQTELMMAAARRHKVATQMGNQGHSSKNHFQFKAWTEAGIIKNVTRITAFMNSPRRWHGMKADGPLPAQPVPGSIDWDSWLSTTAPRDYNAGYTNGEWRSWFDFGNGALGDWGAHILDTAHRFLDLGLPTEITARLEGHNPFIFPQASTLGFKFPARGEKPPLDLTWYDGRQNIAPLPENFGDAVVDPDIPPPTSGAIDTKRRPPGKVIYGEGLTFKGGSHAATLSILPSERAKDIASRLPEVPECPSNHYANFLLACQGEEACRSPFDVAGPLCQTLDLGVIAQRVNADLRFDPASRRITNHAVADALLDGPPPRKEWEQFYKL
ncbi:MAG: hypothetical protein RLZZ50_722 [Verrucomicrobiota bacterium]|jgi:predicted dehydrogenase